MGLRDPDIRLALIPYLISQDVDLWVREEMGIWGCVADVVTVSSHEVHIYEVKSDLDTTERLGDRTKVGRNRRSYTVQGQVTAYGMMADRVTLVVGTVLLEEAILLIPAWWGVLVAVDEPTGVVLVPYREALPNPDLRWVRVFEFLWREEAQGVCERLGIARGVRGASKSKLKKRLKSHGLSLEDLRREVRYVVRARVWDRKWGC